MPYSFYQQPDVVAISRSLLGKYLCTRFNGTPATCGRIVETEAYSAHNDKACHAYQGRYTGRTKIMFAPGGHAYVYLCYGIHHLFNVVTNVEGQADAILIRAIEPSEGLNTMLSRRNMSSSHPRLCNGPGKLTQALGIRTDHYGTDLTSGPIWIEDRNEVLNTQDIRTGPRVGVDYAGDDAKLQWRFRIAGTRWAGKD